MQSKLIIFIAIGLVIVFTIAFMLLTIPSYDSNGEARSESPVLIQGAGASFQFPQISQWASVFKEKYGVVITYQSVGSGAGQRMFLTDKVVHFAASDPPLSRAQHSRFNGSVLQVPWIMGAVVVVYNLPEVDTHLNLTGEVLARIYRGEITHWNDPAITRINPSVADKLPNREIIVVYRSDSSGTTEVFTIFLHKSAPDLWPRTQVGKQLDSPVTRTGRAIGGKGNEGVTAIVKQTPYSIGYVEFSYALEQGLSYASIMNRAGRFVLPSDVSIMSAALGVKLPSSPLDDFSETFEEVIYSPHPDAYPIATFAYGLFWSRYEDAVVARYIALFLRWIANEGYNYMVRGYVKPPDDAIQLLVKAADIIEAGGAG